MDIDEQLSANYTGPNNLEETATILFHPKFVDVCIDIYVVTNSDLYGMCSHCIYGNNLFMG